MDNINNNEKLCRYCGQILPLDDFYKNKRSPDGHTNKCKECTKKYYQNPSNKERAKEYQKEYYNKNKEKIKSYVKQYDATHIKRRKRDGRVKFSNSRVRGNGYITKSQWEECLLFFDNLCAYSGEEFNFSSKQDNLSLEHIIPIECGGCGFPWNIIPVKQSYNSAKHTQNMYEWYVKQKFFSVIRLLKIEAWQKYAYNKWGYLEKEATG